MQKHEFNFDTKSVSSLREAMNDKLNISTKKEDYDASGKFNYYSWSRMCAAMDRIEDTILYINKTPIGDKGHRIAFDFYEFLNNEYVVIESIKTMAFIFSVDLKAIKDIENSNNVFNQEFSDAEYFSYLRSLIAVHPLKTTKKHHENIMVNSNLDCCPRVFWTKEVFGYRDDSDLTMQIYGVDGGDYHSMIPLCISSFEKYLNKWIDLIPTIIKAIHDYNAAQYANFRSERLKTLSDFDNNEIAYLCYLKNENAKRFDDEQDYMFDYYINVLRFYPSDSNNVEPLNKYKNAIRYSLGFLHNSLQNMSPSGFENTGVHSEPYFETDLFNELYFPSLYCDNAFVGYHYNLGKLHYLEGYGDFGDREYVRMLLDEIKEIINRYVVFRNEESGDETVILVRLALYLNALECDCLLNRSIPNDVKYRMRLLPQEEYDELLKPKEKLPEEPNLDILKQLFELFGDDNN